MHYLLLIVSIFAGWHHGNTESLDEQSYIKAISEIIKEGLIDSSNDSVSVAFDEKLGAIPELKELKCNNRLIYIEDGSSNRLDISFKSLASSYNSEFQIKTVSLLFEATNHVGKYSIGQVVFNKYSEDSTYTFERIWYQSAIE